MQVDSVYALKTSNLILMQCQRPAEPSQKGVRPFQDSSSISTTVPGLVYTLSLVYIVPKGLAEFHFQVIRLNASVEVCNVRLTMPCGSYRESASWFMSPLAFQSN